MKQARQPPKSLVRASDIAVRIGLKKAALRQKVRELEARREPYLERWRQIRDYQIPYLGVFDGLDSDDTRAQRKDTKIYNGVAWEANEIFAAGVMSGLTPPSRRWFRMNFADREVADNSDLGKLLDKRIDILNDVLEKSNFYTAIHSCYLELAFGQAPLGIFPDTRYGVHFEAYPIGTYSLATGPDGVVNTFCHTYRMSARQLVDKFGEENVPVSVRQELEQGPGYKPSHKVVWIVEPNEAEDPHALGGYHLPYLSVYYIDGTEDHEFLYIGGFSEWPVPVARYQISGGDCYGKGPGWFAEGDSKGLQLLSKDMLTMVELTVKPPMLATSDSAEKGIHLIPGGKTFTEQQGGVAPLFQVGGNVEHLMAVIQEHEARIKRAYNADLFMMLNNMEDKTMTAREVNERNQEKMTQLGPVVQRMQFEFLGRIIERVYCILEREHYFPQPEDEELIAYLADQEVRIEYISPLAQAQKASSLINIEQPIGFVGQLAQFDPSVLDKVNWHEAVNRYFDLVGAPAALKRTDDEFMEIQQQKREKQAQMEQLQQVGAVAQMAAPAAQAAKNATEAARDGNPVLQQIMGIDPLGMGAGE